jgi:hypothetical protein
MDEQTKKLIAVGRQWGRTATPTWSITLARRWNLALTAMRL